MKKVITTAISEKNIKKLKENKKIYDLSHSYQIDKAIEHMSISEIIELARIKAKEELAEEESANCDCGTDIKPQSVIGGESNG